MTDRERFERAFAPVHASADTVTEVLKMTDANRKPKRAGAARLAARVALIAAIIFVLLTGSAYAAGLYVNSPEQAWKTAQREIQKMKDMGILSQEVQIDGKAERIIDLPEQKGSNYYFGRLFKRSYAVAAQGGDRKYYFHLSIDMETGKITRLSVEAKADENDVPVGESEWWNGEKTEKTYIYANYDDIVPADLTVDELCKNNVSVRIVVCNSRTMHTAGGILGLHRLHAQRHKGRKLRIRHCCAVRGYARIRAGGRTVSYGVF